MWFSRFLALILLVLPASHASEYFGNRVWEDLDGNGEQDPGEPGIPGITIQLWNTARTQLLRTSVSDAAGDYLIIAPAPGDYRLKALLRYPQDRFSPRNAVPGDDADDSDIYPGGGFAGFTDIIPESFGSNSSTFFDIGIISDPMRDGNIGGQAFTVDADGTQGSRTVDGVAVELVGPGGQLLQMTSTDSSGYYRFKAPPGTYQLRFSTPPPYVICHMPNAGTDDTIDSDIDANGVTAWFQLVPGQVLREIDAGYSNKVSLGNFVWHDEDADGIQDEGEDGVANVEIELWDADKTRVWTKTKSDTQGNFIIVPPGPGQYRFFVLRPMISDDFSPRLQGSETGKDSNIYSTETNFGFSEVIDVTPNLISNPSFDIGLVYSPLVLRRVTPLAITKIEPGVNSCKVSFNGQSGGTFRIDRSVDMKTWIETTPFETTASSTTRTLALPAASKQQYFKVWRLR